MPPNFALNRACEHLFFPLQAFFVCAPLSCGDGISATALIPGKKSFMSSLRTLRKVPDIIEPQLLI
jgi:hypothetical protein